MQDRFVFLGAKIPNIALQLALQQCRKASCTFLLWGGICDWMKIIVSFFLWLFLSVGHVDCGKETEICRQVHVRKYPMVALFKTRGHYEWHHGMYSPIIPWGGEVGGAYKW